MAVAVFAALLLWPMVGIWFGATRLSAHYRTAVRLAGMMMLSCGILGLWYGAHVVYGAFVR